MSKPRVAIIGAGPCGMSALYNFEKMGNKCPEIVCYEKQRNWGGLWNYTWMTGTDEFGEPCHGGQYKYLWSNGPKECLEYPDYTFDQHYGKAIPSFPPRPVLRDYLEGRFTKGVNADLKRHIKWTTVVRQIRYNKETDDFTVTAENLEARHTYDEKFTHVIVATGIFNVPNKPTFPGLETFNGRILHSHDFRDSKEFKDQRLLVIGASYSAEDIAMQTKKYGAKSVITCYRSKPMNFKFPPGVEERPLVTKFDSTTAYFKDGSSAEIDTVILCTGYRYQFSYLDDDLRLYSKLSVYPADVYKGSLWLNGGNNKLFYAGIQDQYFSFSMFDVQALWICKYIMGDLPNEPKSAKEMREDEQKWSTRAKNLKDCHEDIDCQADYIEDLCIATGYNKDVAKGGVMFHKWEHDKDDNIVTYRDQPFKSIFTGTEGAKHKPWYEDFDDSIAAFVN